ncbi:MAG: protein-tyrosine-phosphatase [Gracilimonas sp.]|uniref:protein-tyrosine-phosphatase n=1 Tax=Gracilimonas TaxID=649462 RepID=UPI001B25A016|nr:protein-tyrosine-phosphatase [Gracilimonas sp.]MBO6585921.1 protein-tyrosine-phosphatase [Gracilimonas sp.]MBO6616918.1 protein-tyrosine-phosphatase [Gracilimonas sp.]
MYSKLKEYIQKLESGYDSIPEQRKENLKKLSAYIKTKTENDQVAKLNYICTHNSRRSHLAQIWTAAAAHYYRIDNIETYSGGTEATAFNTRAVAAIERAGFIVDNPGGGNPRYQITFSEEAASLTCFSKKFDDNVNPDTSFAAVMTCSDADKNCPFVPGTEFRIAVTYRDPKESDGTDKEKETYDERCFQIAKEMFYMMSKV